MRTWESGNRLYPSCAAGGGAEAGREIGTGSSWPLCFANSDRSRRRRRSSRQVRKTTGNDFQKSQVTAEGIKANDLLQARKPAEAAEIYRRMLEENPHNAWTAYNLALALEAMKDLKGAEDELLRAVGIDSKLAKPRAELGRLRLTAGDLPGAEKWLESAP